MKKNYYEHSSHLLQGVIMSNEYMLACGSSTGNLNMTQNHCEMTICKDTAPEAIIQACLLKECGFA